MPPDINTSNKPGKATTFPPSQKHIIVEIVEYVPDSIVSKTVIMKTSGNVAVTSFDEGEKLCEKMVEYDTYVQIIEGIAKVTINAKEYTLTLGEGIVIPAHTSHCFKADEQFKMITTIIKDYNEEKK
jgi:quercetin dioxygenase-like cupin family protein